MRTLLALAMLMALSAVVIAGCGTSFPLPTETRTGRGYSSDNSYQMVGTWTFSDTVADILLTQGAGSQLFLLFRFPGPGLGTAPRGKVQGFALKAAPPNPSPLAGIEFRGLFSPSAMAAGSGKVFVLDEGDTCLARLSPCTGRCDTTRAPDGCDPEVPRPWSNQVTDLSPYWRVREYGLLGGDTISTFTDTSMAFVRGVAADDQGRVYVAGSAIVLIPDQQDPRIRTRSFQFRVHRYLRVTPGSVPPDPFMPGTNRWIRDPNFIVEEGSGAGTLQDPRGLYWAGSSGQSGPGLFAADFGKDWVQKLSDANSSTGVYRIEADSTTSLNRPADVTADRAGFVYVADTGNQRVLRYDPYGDFVQRVDVEPDSYGKRLVGPVAVAADDSLVYVSDGPELKVVRYQRRK